MKRRAWVFAIALAALATSLSFATAPADPRQDWAKCLSAAKISPDERISSCTAALASGTDQWAASRAHNLRGRAYLDKRDFEAAVDDFSQFIRFYPNDMQAFQCRAIAYFRQHKLDLAIADYTRIIEFNPTSVTYAYHAHVWRSEVYLAKDDVDQSIADASKAIEINPKSVAAYQARGHAYVAKGDLESAIADFNEAVRLDPEDKNSYVGRAATYWRAGAFDLALADHDQAIRLDSKGARSYRGRGMIYWQAGSFSKSLTDFNEAARLDPKSTHVALWREIIAKRSGQPSQLPEAATQLDMSKWPAPIVNLFLGGLTPEQVMDAADDADPKKKKGKVCEANFYLGEFALQRGSREDAQHLLEQAATNCPKTFVESRAASIELKALSANP